MTFPRNEGQLPLYYNRMSTGRPKMNEPESVFWSHYIDEENTPEFAFGHGLSYSKFEYSNLKLNKDSFSSTEEIEVSVTLKNNSNVKGKEVVQLYIQDIICSITRPIQELRDFKMVELNPNETKIITFKVNKETLGFYNNNLQWIVEPGEFNLFIGGSSDKTLQTKFSYE